MRLGSAGSSEAVFRALDMDIRCVVTIRIAHKSADTHSIATVIMILALTFLACSPMVLRKANPETKDIRPQFKPGQMRFTEREKNKKLLSSIKFDSTVNVPLNLAKKEDAPYIMINKHIAHAIKRPHGEGDASCSAS